MNSTKIEKPQSQIEEVLYYLLTRLQIDRRSMMIATGVLNLPEAIRKLRHNYGVYVVTSEVSTVNKFGREIKYALYSVKDKARARSVYDKIQLARIKRNSYE